MSQSLGGINLVLLGDNSQLNGAVASITAPTLGYTPVHTIDVIEELKGQPVHSLIETEGESQLGLCLLESIEMMEADQG